MTLTNYNDMLYSMLLIFEHAKIGNKLLSVNAEVPLKSAALSTLTFAVYILVLRRKIVSFFDYVKRAK